MGPRFPGFLRVLGPLALGAPLFGLSAWALGPAALAKLFNYHAGTGVLRVLKVAPPTTHHQQAQDAGADVGPSYVLDTV